LRLPFSPITGEIKFRDGRGDLIRLETSLELRFANPVKGSNAGGDNRLLRNQMTILQLRIPTRSNNSQVVNNEKITKKK